jgi:ribosomal protein S21
MLKVKVKEGKGSIEKALKEYKSKLIKTRQMTELNDRRVYEKGSVKRRKQKKKAIYVNKKYKNNNE